MMMISLSTLARLVGRRYHFWNGLAVTALVGLFYEPRWLTNIGFQLSYLAVAGIGLLYHRLESMLEVQRPFFKRWWQVTTISLSVQLATLPLSLYYFHYFPTYLLLGNFVAVPAASLMLGLGLGLLVCMLGELPWIGTFAGSTLSYLASGLYRYALWLSELPCSRLGPFWPSLSEVILAYGLIISLVAFFMIRKFRYVPIATVCALVLSMCSVSRWYQQSKQEMLIIYAIPHHRAASLIMGQRALVLRDGMLEEGSVCYAREVRPSMEAMGVSKVVSCTFKGKEGALGLDVSYKRWKGLSVLVWRGKSVAWLDKERGMPPRLTRQWEIDVLVVDGGCLPTLAPWLVQLHPQVVVLGCTLTYKQRARLKKELLEHGVDYHDLLEEGALRY